MMLESALNKPQTSNQRNNQTNKRNKTKIHVYQVISDNLENFKIINSNVLFIIMNYYITILYLALDTFGVGTKSVDLVPPKTQIKTLYNHETNELWFKNLLLIENKISVILKKT